MRRALLRGALGGRPLEALGVVLLAGVGCSSSDPASLDTVDLAGQWVLWDSSNLGNFIPPGVTSNACVMQMPVIFVESPNSGGGAWVATQDTGAFRYCEVNGTVYPPAPLPYVDRQFNVIRLGDSIVFSDAGGSRSRIFPGRMRSQRWMEGRRDSTSDGRRGVWHAARPGLLPGLRE